MRGRAIFFKFPFRWRSFSRNLSVVVFVNKTNSKQYRSPRLPPFCSTSIREGRVALSVGHPRATHSRYVIGCCLIPLEICGVKNNSRRITYRIGCVWGMPFLSPLSSLGGNLTLFCHIFLTIVNGFTVKTKMICCSCDCKEYKILLNFRQEKRNHI